MADTIRIAVFLTALLLLAAVELKRPRIGVGEGPGRIRHYGFNALFLAGNMVFLRLLFPFGLIGVCLALEASPAPLLRLSEMPGLAALPPMAALAAESVAIIVVFDFVLWLQHMLFHRLDWLWRLHRIHHSDELLDVSTGFRFNPAEVFLSFLVKIGVILALAPSAMALTIWLLLFNLWTLLTHADIALHPVIERWLGAAFITPDVHRVHHLNEVRFQNSNYGSIFNVWDRLFGTRITASPEQLRRTPVGLDAKATPASAWAGRD